MPLVEISVILSVLVFEIFFLFQCLRLIRFNKPYPISFGVGMFIVGQFLCVLTFLMGKDFPVYEEYGTHLYKLAWDHSELNRAIVNPDGDPTLLRFASQKQKDIIRPNLESSNEFFSWQIVKRTLLRGLFDFSSRPHAIIAERNKAEIVEQVTNRGSVTLQSFDGTLIPGFLFTPKSDKPAPGIVVLSGHVAEDQEGIRQTAGLVQSYQHAAALELAKVGNVVLTIEFRGFGKLGPVIGTEHRLVAFNAILGGSFYKEIITKDIRNAVDFLSALPEVDSSRLGITGVSFGGEMAVTYAAMDERMKVVVFQGFGGAVGPVKGVAGTVADQPHYCHIIPGFNKKFYQEDLPLLIAPRPLLGVRGDREVLESTVEFENIVGKAYEILGSPEAFKFRKEPGGHEYFVRPAVEFFQKFL